MIASREEKRDAYHRWAVRRLWEAEETTYNVLVAHSDWSQGTKDQLIATALRYARFARRSAYRAADLAYSDTLDEYRAAVELLQDARDAESLLDRMHTGH